MEADAKHNLDVARQAFSPLKKAYKQVILRFEETYAAYPEFSGIEEFLYMAGMSSYYLSENKGRQKVDARSERDMEKYAPAKLREDAMTYLSTLVEKYPDSQYREKADKTLKKLNSQK
jgi:outer membrane protein assembly factor BamD (BamD/ComL family)